MSNAQLILLGCLGGLLPDALRLVKNRHTVELPAYIKSANFFVGVLLMVVLGGLAAFLLEASDPKQALLYGYSGPELITRLAASVSEQGVARATAASSAWPAMRKWWSTA